jgi:flagellar motor switch protein FliN/FliY
MPVDETIFDEPEKEAKPKAPKHPPESFDDAAKPGDARKAIYGVPIEVTVSVGHARPMIHEIVALRRDSVLPLDSRVEDPVEVYVGNQLIARGELQELEDDGGRLGVRLTEIMDLGNGS